VGVLGSARFYYGPSRSRYKRQDTDSAAGTGAITTTHYIGAVEILLKPTGTWEKKRYIGGVLVMTLRSDGEGSKEYLFTDHLGSTDRIAHRFGNTIQRMSFDAFGARRNPTATNAPTPWGTFSIVQQLNFDTSHTTHGYTGHEGADKVGLIHMNGRMYDPVLGRFIQADSIVQDPFDPQSLNRYAYVLNNPLSATDPSGNISFKNALRLGVSIGIAVYSGGLAAGLVAEHMFAAAVVVTAFGGAAAATVAVGPKGAVRGAITSLVFFGVGQGASALQGAKVDTLRHAAFANNGLGRAALHGLAGGTLASLQGGKFGHGFVTAGVGKAVTSHVALTGNDYFDGAIAALVGGTLSEASGESFTNGALTAAMQFAFNQLFGSDDNRCTAVECEEVQETRREFFRRGGEQLEEAGAHALKEGAEMTLAGRVSKYFSGVIGRIGGFFRSTKSLDDLSKAAGAMDKGGFSAAGRSLTKHGVGARSGNSLFPKAKGNPAAINRQAQDLVDDILTNPDTKVINSHRARFGNTIEHVAPDGRGVVFDSNGKFLFFREGGL